MHRSWIHYWLSWRVQHIDSKRGCRTPRLAWLSKLAPVILDPAILLDLLEILPWSWPRRCNIGNGGFCRAIRLNSLAAVSANAGNSSRYSEAGFPKSNAQGFCRDSCEMPRVHFEIRDDFPNRCRVSINLMRMVYDEDVAIFSASFTSLWLFTGRYKSTWCSHNRAWLICSIYHMAVL